MVVPHDALRISCITKGEVVVPATVVEIQRKCLFRAQFLKLDASAVNVAAFAESLCEGATVQKVIVPDRVEVFERRCFANSAAQREWCSGQVHNSRKFRRSRSSGRS
jgi:hypothetical protein